MTVTSRFSRTGLVRAWRELDRGERRSLVGMTVTVLALNVIGWGVLFAVVVPGHYTIHGSAFGVGLGVTAYTLGMRHAFDADHIAAIDNTTRKLVAENKKPMSVGFWFSLGHSTIVFVLVALLAFGVRELAASLSDDNSDLTRWTGVFGTLVSGTFLLLIGLLNLMSFIAIHRVFREMKRGAYDEARLERELDNRGALNRLLKPVVAAVRAPWHMYPVGLLFGMGFDTVTEVGLLVIAGGAAATGLPWYSILVLPILFCAGMSLFDSIDGSFMNFAYGWALARPLRKIYYNLVVTGLSVVVAMLIGAQEIISLLTAKFDVTDGLLGWIGALDLGAMGFIIVGLFIGTWLTAVLVWQYGGVQARWESGLAAAVPRGRTAAVPPERTTSPSPRRRRHPSDEPLCPWWPRPRVSSTEAGTRP
ncbi:HoxN/HupN/NixA family nickel/cobalt transporter [Rhodococcus sp. MTM3W5.2]|uniref:HoxN/HupN/NixA family nickel/cobalt transporter n=1 Tax=Rhodococcus sp. MTM3W5.2 TaxID=1805827 RepID=UPI0009F83D0A|nr:HoxN/HupN/NixA family nickel/cobalt transporter [Rhodococcus sp. MTM3W5.2]